jgi:predicted kinase
VLFDAIEFDEAIATSDILYDLAFLIMDLCERKLSADANRLLNEYLWSCDDELQEIEGLALFPLFLSLRAVIRAKVTAAQLKLDADDTRMRQEAQTYLETAQRFLDPIPARLIAIGGLSGTGKSTLAAAIAPPLGLAPGALHVRSDIERKRVSTMAATQHLPAQDYRPEVSVQVYARLRVLAEVGLRAGRCVILDATYRDRRERDEVEGWATRLRVGFLGLWLEAPTDILTQRVAMRQGDVSDATAAVVSAQAKQDVGRMTWQRLDAGVPRERLKEAALELIARAPC